ncbi:hypothetical protein [Brevundimonas sp.]|uniref:hypothetical protein n=1 Tax=Brevundimonas sp. TaxID=1871086 RepID=UPI0035686F3C
MLAGISIEREVFECQLFIDDDMEAGDEKDHSDFILSSSLSMIFLSRVFSLAAEEAGLVLIFWFTGFHAIPRFIPLALELIFSLSADFLAANFFA